MAGFALPPLAALGRVPPLRVLRRDMLPIPASTWTVYGAALLALGLIMWRMSLDMVLTFALLGGGVIAAVVLGGILLLGLQSLRRLLERNGMNVLTAKDGIDAIAVLEEHTPDLMLLDIEMPRMDGFEVATQVRNDPRLMRLPIIMITSRTGQKHRDRAMAIGVNDYLGKPYQESVLLESIALWSKPHA